MKRKYLVIAILAIVIGAVLLIIKKKHEIASLPKPQAYKQTIQTAMITRGKLEVTNHYLGVIEPYTRADISARISGNILNLPKREGDNVRQGELIVTIDDRELADRALAINAEALATKQKLAGARSAYETQKSIYARDIRLFKEGAISQEALERSRSLHDGAQATLAATHEILRGLHKSTAAARTQAGYARIYAPFDGIVVKRWNEPGDLAVPGKPLLTIEKLSPWKVIINVSQEEIGRINKGTKAYLRSGQQTMTATVDRVFPSLGRNLLGSVELIMPTPPFSLPSGASVGVDIVVKEVNGFIVPDNAIVKTDKGVFIYLIDKDVIRIRQVDLLGTGMGSAAISGPINTDQLVAIGQENKLLSLVDGSAVNPVGITP